MKYNEFNLGQIETVFNKLGGIDGVKAFLAGRLEVVKRKFHQFGDDFLNGKGLIIIPKDYNHDTQIDEFEKAYGEDAWKSTYYYNSDLTSKNFAKATTKLVPGKTYEVVMVPILETVKSEDCLAFIEYEKGIKIGGQGVTLLHDKQPDIFPVGKWTVAFDEKDALWKDADGDHRVPYVYRYSDGDRLFNLCSFEFSWDSESMLVFLRDVKKS